MTAGPAKTSAGPEDALDLVVFAEIRAFGDEFLIDLVDQFFQEADGLLVELRDTLGSGDAPAVGRLAHKLRGSCAQMGGLRAAAACGALEDTAVAGRLAELPAELEAVASAYDELCRALTDELTRA